MEFRKLGDRCIDGPGRFYAFRDADFVRQEKSRCETDRELIMQIINVDLMKNPINWFIVLMMLVIFGMAADVVLRYNRTITGATSTTPTN